MKRCQKRIYWYHIPAIIVFILILCISTTACTVESTDTDTETYSFEHSTQSESVNEESSSEEESSDSQNTQPGNETGDNSETTVTENDETSGETESESQTSEETTVDPSTVERITMPRLDIVTDNGQMITGDNLNKPVYHSSVSMSSCDEKYAFDSLGAEVHVRGNSTAGAPKKPYALKFDEKQSVLGLNDGKTFRSWVLLADYYDETMLRNQTAFRLGDLLLEDKWFSADSAHVEVYINGEYQGVYTLCEKTQIKTNRINIEEKEETDLTTLQTGYLLIGQGGIWWEDNYFDIPIGFTVTDRSGDSMYYGGIRFVLSGGDEYSAEQRQFISDYCSQVFQVMYEALYNNKYYTLTKKGRMEKNRTLQNDNTKTDAEKQYETINAVFDLDSAARMCVLDEIAKNLDAMTFNMYVDLSPEGDGRLTLAAPWDFDHAMAKTHYSSTHSTSGFYATNLSRSDGIRVNFLTVMLGGFDWFNDMCSEIWKEKYPEIRKLVNDMLIENYRYEEAFERDWEKWGHPKYRAQTGHHTPADIDSFTCHTDSAVFLANWLNRRITWLNIQWGDGQNDQVEIPNADLLKVDFTQASSISYLTGFNNCSYTQTKEGLKVVVEGGDPYFSVDYDHLMEEFEAEDFPIVRITCMVPNTNSESVYYFEYHLCAGKYQNATSGVKSGFMLDRPRGQYYTYETDLLGTGFWNGLIHSLRVDFFAGGEIGDYIIIKDISLERS